VGSGPRQRAQSRTKVGSTTVQLDAFYRTRVYPAIDELLPGKREAVGVFPSGPACRDELRPLAVPPADATVARALVLSSFPRVTRR
jgi:hypothetical protein